jgi:hypothetical protein
MTIRIKNSQKLIDIWKVIAWLDAGRWCNESNYNFINFFRNDLTNSEKILTHWLCYITDRQMPFEIVWEKGGYVFSELVHTYSYSNCSSQVLLNKYYESYIDNKGKKRYRFRSTDNTIFASRYVTDDYQNILQTLQVLENYNRNLVKYILSIIKQYQTEENLFLIIACCLHILTYQLGLHKKADPEKATQTLNDLNKFKETFTAFKRDLTNGKKRLWCSIRDYKKGLYSKIFNEAIKEAAGKQAGESIKLWNSLPMNQIELPGDVWNNSPILRNNLIGNVAEIETVPNWTMSEIIRKLYEQLKREDQRIEFYPEQFDVTFDFVPRMCFKKLCNVCPFGKNGAELICVSDSEKYCPISLVSCGYFAKCVGQKDCLIREKMGKGICKGRLV